MSNKNVTINNVFYRSQLKIDPDEKQKLRTGEITWDQVPAANYKATTDCSSALLRTDWPHTVFQGPGMRITVSCQIVFPNCHPTGVWQHIHENSNWLEKHFILSTK